MSSRDKSVEVGSLKSGTPVIFRRSDDPDSVLSRGSEGVFLGLNDEGMARVQRKTEYGISVHRVEPRMVDEVIDELSISSEDVLSDGGSNNCPRCGGCMISRNGRMRCSSCWHYSKSLSGRGM